MGRKAKPELHSPRRRPDPADGGAGPAPSEAEQHLTHVIRGASGGDPKAVRRIVDVLRRFASSRFLRFEKAGHSLQSTLLADEAYVRLFCRGPGEFIDRAHFFCAAAEVIRHFLVDHARERKTLKRGGRVRRVDLADADIPLAESGIDRAEEVAVALEKLAALSPRAAQLVKLRYYTGLQSAEAAEILGISVKTAYGDWTFARAWLARELKES